MNARRIGLPLMVLAVLLAVLAVLLAAGSRKPGEAPPWMVDPAIAFHTGTHDASYGGIDRWAYYGMQAGAVAELLRQDGYACTQPQPPAGGERLNGVHDMVCSKQLSWPLPRTLSITAAIDHDMRGRLVAASARSTLAGGEQPMRKRIADFLRHKGWIEPEQLQITGFAIESVDTLARLAADALARNGWHRSCDENRATPACVAYARKRRESGLPPLPQGTIAAGDAMAIASAMEQVRLLPPVPRAADKLPEDSLLVRVADQKMWLDFVGRDLTGRALKASVALDSEGGTPTQLVATLGTESKVVPLAGTPRRANSGALVYLVPEAGARNPRAGMWLNMPNDRLPGTFTRLAEVLPHTDPAFIPGMVKTVIAHMAADVLPDERLGLYPALHLIDQRANALRRAHADTWLPRDLGNRLIKQAFQDDPATRAAWAVATCESTGTQAPVIDADCWLRFVIADPDAAALVRSDVDALQLLYAKLAPTHPLLVRLNRLNDAFPHD